MLELRELDPARDLLDVSPPRSPEFAGRAGERDEWQPSHRRRRALAFAVTALLVGGGVALLATGSRDGSSAAAAVLRAQASIAGRAQGIPGHGYRYTKVTEATLGTFADAGSSGGSGGFSVRNPRLIETWLAVDGSGRVEIHDRPPEFPGPRDEARWKAAGKPRVDFRQSIAGLGPKQGGGRFGPGGFSGRSGEGNLPPVDRLPADPDQLETIFRDEARRSSSSVPEDVKVFEYSASVLINPGASPEQRSALYALVASLPGVGLVRDVEDPNGRLGTAVYLDSDYSGAPERNMLIFDPKSSQVLAHTEALLDRQSFIDSRILDYQVLDETGTVDRLRDTP